MHVARPAPKTSNASFAKAVAAPKSTRPQILATVAASSPPTVSNIPRRVSGYNLNHLLPKAASTWRALVGSEGTWSRFSKPLAACRKSAARVCSSYRMARRLHLADHVPESWSTAHRLEALRNHVPQPPQGREPRCLAMHRGCGWLSEFSAPTLPLKPNRRRVI